MLYTKRDKAVQMCVSSSVRGGAGRKRVFEASSAVGSGSFRGCWFVKQATQARAEIIHLGAAFIAAFIHLGAD